MRDLGSLVDRKLLPTLWANFFEILFATRDGTDEATWLKWLAKILAPLTLDQTAGTNFVGYTLDNYIKEAVQWVEQAPPSLHE